MAISLVCGAVVNGRKHEWMESSSLVYINIQKYDNDARTDAHIRWNKSMIL